MPWLELLQIPLPSTPQPTKTDIWMKLVAIAPVFALLTSVANLFLAIYVFSYTKRKNYTDTKIKWFLELVYTPNKDAFAAYFKNLHKLKEKIPAEGNWTEQIRIDLMSEVKAEKSVFEQEFVNMLQGIAPATHKKVSASVEKVTDKLVTAIDNDELRLENSKTYAREFANPILEAKNEIISAVFEYKG